MCDLNIKNYILCRFLKSHNIKGTKSYKQASKRELICPKKRAKSYATKFAKQAEKRLIFSKKHHLTL